MAGWCWWAGSALGLGLAVGVACSSTESKEEPACTPHQFRACDAGCGSGRGAQQCVEVAEGSGQFAWSSCGCVVLDGSFVEPDAEADGSLDGDAAADALLDTSPGDDAGLDAGAEPADADLDAEAEPADADLDAEADA